MRQLINKEAYEAPLTTKRVVTMEGNCMAASGEEQKNVKMEAGTHTAGEEFDFSQGDWD